MQRLPFDQELRQLKKILKQYEKEFFKFHRRKPSKSDWTSCRKAQYKRYDYLKQRIENKTEMTDLEKLEYIPKLAFKSMDEPPTRIVTTTKIEIQATPHKNRELLSVNEEDIFITPTKQDSAVILTPIKSQEIEFIPCYSTEKQLPQISMASSPTPIKSNLLFRTPRKSLNLSISNDINWADLDSPSKPCENIEFKIPDEFLSKELRAFQKESTSDHNDVSSDFAPSDQGILNLIRKWISYKKEEIK
eukprot:NODE_234_length_12000_cov_0.516343.p4 type:complete len:247 gc:universal NODE_234_length_12000_cov_0.516343:3469-4209(+)